MDKQKVIIWMIEYTRLNKSDSYFFVTKVHTCSIMTKGQALEILKKFGGHEDVDRIVKVSKL